MGREGKTVTVTLLVSDDMKCLHFDDFSVKNITEVALLTLLMSYEKKLRCFKFIISNSIVEINEQTLSEYVSTHVAHDIFEVRIS